MSITVYRELDVALVLVPKRLPQERYVLALIEEKGPWHLLVLYGVSEPIHGGKCLRTHILNPTGYVLKPVQFLHAMRYVSRCPVVERATRTLRTVEVERLREAATRE